MIGVPQLIWPEQYNLSRNSKASYSSDFPLRKVSEFYRQSIWKILKSFGV